MVVLMLTVQRMPDNFSIHVFWHHNPNAQLMFLASQTLRSLRNINAIDIDTKKNRLSFDLSLKGNLFIPKDLIWIRNSSSEIELPSIFFLNKESFLFCLSCKTNSSRTTMAVAICTKRPMSRLPRFILRFLVLFSWLLLLW